MEKLKSRKFITNLILQLVGVVASVLGATLAPEDLEMAERLTVMLAPLLINLASGLKYIDAEAKNDALDMVRQISESETARTLETTTERVGDTVKTVTRPSVGALVGGASTLRNRGNE